MMLPDKDKNIRGLTSSGEDLVTCVFTGTCLFHLDYLIFWQTTSHSIFFEVFFSFSSLNMSSTAFCFHSFEESAVNLVETPWFMMSHFCYFQVSFCL